MANGELKGFATWGRAGALLLTFLSARAAIHAIRQAEGTLPPSEHVILLRSINKKLERIAPRNEPVEDIDYYDIL